MSYEKVYPTSYLKTTAQEPKTDAQENLSLLIYIPPSNQARDKPLTGLFRPRATAISVHSHSWRCQQVPHPKIYPEAAAAQHSTTRRWVTELSVPTAPKMTGTRGGAWPLVNSLIGAKTATFCAAIGRTV